MIYVIQILHQKFLNFIFDRIKLSHHSLSYIIRYIDNKNDKSNSDEESYEIAELIISQYKKE